MGIIVPSPHIMVENESVPPLLDHIQAIVLVGSLEQMADSRKEDAVHFVPSCHVISEASTYVADVTDDILGRDRLNPDE